MRVTYSTYRDKLRTRLWELLSRFASTDAPRSETDSTGEIWIWRERVFYGVFLASLVLLTIPYFPTLIAAVKTGIWIHAAAYTFFYLLVIVVLFVKRVSFVYRAVLGLTLIYVVALYTLDIAGLQGSGRIYLFFFSLMACTLLGLKYGLAALGVNVVTLVLFLLFGANREESWNQLFATLGHTDGWLITSGTFTLMNSVAVISLAVLFRGLESGLSTSKKLQMELEQERAHLSAINRELTRQIEERSRAELALRENEEHLRSLMESAAHFAVFRLVHDDTAPLKFKVVFVSPSIVDIVGVPEPMRFETWFHGLHPDDRDRIFEANRKLFATYKFNEIMRVFNPAQKEWRWIRTISTGIPDDQNRLLFANGIVLDITERKRAEEELMAHREHLRQMGYELLLTEERERRRIAVDLHDHIGQSLAISKIRLKTLRNAIVPMELTASIDQVCDLIEQMIQEIRTLTFDLSPPILYELGLESALEWLTEEIQDKYGITTELERHWRPMNLTDDVRVFLFRAVRELLMNVVKHAQASRARIVIMSDSEQIQIVVEDDGIGFHAPTASRPNSQMSGFGLFSIRERLDSIGGRLDIEHRREGGTRATLVLPVLSPE